MAKIYLASSWRNERQPDAVKFLRALGHEVYDFRDAPTAFRWEELAPYWDSWSLADFRDALGNSSVARAAFKGDMEALSECDAVVMMLPCGRSAHLEAGWALGVGKKVCVVLDSRGFEPELMYLMAGYIAVSIEDCAGWLSEL